MGRTMPSCRVKKVALENVGLARQRICAADKSALAEARRCLETGEALRARTVGCHSVVDRPADTLEAFIRGLDVRCIGELAELVPEGMDDRLPGWAYGPAEAGLEETGREISPSALDWLRFTVSIDRPERRA